VPDSTELKIVDVTDPQDLAAGDFNAWLRHTLTALKVNGEADVPCGSCNACCRSGYFIHIAAEEADARAHIPEALLFPAPGQPKGSMLMGYDENGHCPMLVDDACSIYQHRPRTCRNYDCRVFAAAGISADDNDKPLVAERAQHWRFDYSGESDKEAHASVQAAATFIKEAADALPGGGPSNSTQLAVLATKVHGVFQNTRPESTEGVVEAIATAARQFEE